MLRLLSRLRAAPREERARKPHRALGPEVAPLEGRALLQFGVAFTVTPNVLLPFNGQYVPVEIKGTGTEFTVVNLPGGKYRLNFGDAPGPKQARLLIVDEYRRTQLSAPITLTSNGSPVFSFDTTIHLQAKRSSEFPAGRRYYVTVGLHDDAGWTGLTKAVQVPHSKATIAIPPPAPKK